MVIKALALAVLLLNLVGFQQSFAEDFPSVPAQELTPGQLCANPNSHRYPEKVAYCNRDVSPVLKKQIIEEYDRTFGYNIEKMPRDQFKIDHYIPLCAGGSNDISNLWPQHMSVYKITDSLEQAVCGKMYDGKLLQKEAVRLIMTAKNNLKKAPSILAYVHQL